MDPKTFRLLAEADWGKIIKELVAFALWRATKYEWRYGKGRDLALGQSVEDIVQHVILKTLNNDRKWDPEKGDLVPWLKDQIKSVMDALVKSAAHRYEQESLEGMDEQGIGDRIEYLASEAAAPASSQLADPRQLVLHKEEIDQRVDALYEAMDGEPELEEILSAILNGCEPKPRVLAAKLGVSVKDINNRSKRILRRASKVKGGV